MTRTFIRFLLSLGAWGLVAMGVFDSSILVLPFGNDLLVIALTARHPQWFWLYALAATGGSLLGCTITDYLARKLSEARLGRIVKRERLEAIQKKLKDRIFWALGLAALMPPPFPFTVFLVAAAALRISRWRILTSVAIGRFVRFVAVSLLAVRFGRSLIRLARRHEIEYFVIALAVVSLAGSAFSVVKWVRSSPRRGIQQPPMPSGASS